MSVRIYELSKELNMENKEVMQLLRERGHEVKSASSTVDNISAQALIEEFSGNGSAATETEESVAQPAAPVETVKPGPAVPKLPPSAIVKTPAQIEQERREKDAAEDAARQQREDEREAARQAQR
ncbi:MAG: translation initiation factor IF-2 N-terminal domain-containing protein, partial [Verrucomicrobiota bacterium JB024]|nr:translation initiation factor IF-2 N-terminal domain-containing protein [Verrucomicrobiota bacterium JB024]